VGGGAVGSDHRRGCVRCMLRGRRLGVFLRRRRLGLVPQHGAEDGKRHLGQRVGAIASVHRRGQAAWRRGLVLMPIEPVVSISGGQHVQQHCTRDGDQHSMLAAGSAWTLYAPEGPERGSISSWRPWPYLRSAVRSTCAPGGLSPSPRAGAICWRASAHLTTQGLTTYKPQLAQRGSMQGRYSQSRGKSTLGLRKRCVAGGQSLYNASAASSKTPYTAGPCTRMVGSVIPLITRSLSFLPPYNGLAVVRDLHARGTLQRRHVPGPLAHASPKLQPRRNWPSTKHTAQAGP
jgi:hypothetical protein